ncbi:MAG: DUF2007 domain-containing protein [Chloroflexi bacterium]|nr:DUF2007 domain-containing protein [Chloroflexota bacterium]
MGVEPEMITVYVSQGPLAAEVAKSKLESAGIPVLLRYESIGRILGLTVDGLGQVEVQVPAKWEPQARELLQEDRWEDLSAPGPSEAQ